PIIYPDGTVRVIASTFPFLGVSVALALSSPSMSTVRIPGKFAQSIMGPVIFSGILIFGGIFLFICFNRIFPRTIDSGLVKMDGDVIAPTGTGFPYFNVLSEEGHKRSFIPSVKASDFFSDQSFGGNERAEFYRKLKPPFSIAFLSSLMGRNLQFGNGCIAILPLGAVSEEPGIQSFSLTNSGQSGIFFAEVQE
ncbi:MAG: hypothetical protein ACD_28C00037G0001, partial [uncultured bacterium]